MSASVSLDWLAVTIPVDKNFDVIFSRLSDFFSEKIVSRGRGARGYSDSADILDGGFIAWSLDKLVNGVHVVLNSSSLAILKKKYSVFDVFQFFGGLSGRATRLDFAFDDFSELLDLSVIVNLLSEGVVSSRWKSFRVVQGSSEIGKSDFSGFTVYVGSRQSESFLRIYDKFEEQKNKGVVIPDDVSFWVRCEIELKGDKAAKIFDDCCAFTEDLRFSEYLAGILYGLIDFKDIRFFNDDVVITRLPSAGWWLSFLDVVSKIPVSLPQKIKTIETLKNWFDVSVSPSLAIVSELPGGEDWIFETLKLGRKRWKRKHKDLYFGELDKGLDIRLSELGLQ